MIVEFSVKNFRSIKDLQTISFVATGLKSPLAEIDNNNISSEVNINLLKTIGLYGANASGKSNIVRALEYFLDAIKCEPSSESNLCQLCDPFLYQENPYDSESFFQIVLCVNGKKYRYGFTVKRNPKVPEKPDEKISREVIVSEWLFGPKEKNIVALFTRKGKNDVNNKLTNSDKIPALPYEHSLFLTHSAAFDSDGDCALIKRFISGWTISNFTDGLEPFRWNSLMMIENKYLDGKKSFLELLSSFNLEYNDIFLEREPNQSIDSILPYNKIFLTKTYKTKSNESKSIRLNLANNESSGTQKLFDLAGVLIRAFNLNVGAFIILDEIDSNFHPSLLIKLIGLFNNPLINKSNSQLLFTSHDTNLMSPAVMRRDQFYFTEKGEDDSTRVYSLADLKGIRNDADFAKEYLAGFYGALPILDKYSNENVNK